MKKKKLYEYRALARMTMKGHYGTMLLASVLVIIIQSALSQIFTRLFSAADSIIMIGAYGLLELIVSLIISGPLIIGLNGFFVRCVSGEYDLKNVFLPFKTNLTNTVKVYFFMQLKLFLWLLIPWLIGMTVVVSAVIFLNGEAIEALAIQFANSFSHIAYGDVASLNSEALEMFFTLYFSLLGVSVIFMIPGIIKSYEYAMIPYIVAEDADISVKEAFKRTKLMMKGNKFRYFALNLSFIGWILLGILALGFGILFVMPYVFAATTHFYIDAKSRVDGKASFTNEAAGNYSDIDKGDSFGV